MRLANALLCVGLCGTGAWAQSVISAHSGVVHYIEGDVAIDGTSLHPKFGEFPDIKNGQVLSTEEGRAEILLTPGVFLRLAENSSVRMVSNALADTHLQLVSGTALIEAGELLPHNSITIDCAGVQIDIPKKGLYGIDADAARLRVYDGQAQASLGEQQVVARKSHEIALDNEALADTKFDAKETDPFYRWNARRAEYISEANIASARVESNSSAYSGSGYVGGGFGGGALAGAWNWNPYFGMFTFLPATGVYMSPFGATFYSPGMLNAYFLAQGPYGYYGNGYGYGYGYGGRAVYGGTPVAAGSVSSRPGSFGGGSRAAVAGGGGFAGASHAGGGGHPGGGGAHR